MDSKEDLIKRIQKTVWYIEAEFETAPTQCGSAVLVELIDFREPNSRPQKFLLSCKHVTTRVEYSKTTREYEYGEPKRIRCWPPGREYHPNSDDGFLVVHELDLGQRLNLTSFTSADDWVLLDFESADKLNEIETVTAQWNLDENKIPTSELTIVGYPDGPKTRDGIAKIINTAIQDRTRSTELDKFSFSVDTLETKNGMSGGGCFDSDGVFVGLHREGNDRGIERFEIRVDWIASELEPKFVPVEPDFASRESGKDDDDSSKLDFRIRAKREIAELKKEVELHLASVSEPCMEKIKSRFKTDFEGGKSKSLGFVAWLVEEFAHVKALARFNKIAGESTEADANKLNKVSSAFIPLCFYKENSKVRAQLDSPSFEIISCPRESIAEVVMAAFEAKPIEYRKGSYDVGVSAFRFFNPGTYGREDAKTKTLSVSALFSDLLSAWDTCVGLPKTNWDELSLDELTLHLQQKVAYVEDENERSVYCLVRFPRDEFESKNLKEVLEVAAERVPNLVFCRIEGEMKPVEAYVFEAIKNLQKLGHND